MLVLVLFGMLRWHVNNIQRFETLKEPNENISIDLQKLKTEVEKKTVSHIDIENTDQK